METLGDKIQPKFSQNSAFKYYCNFCDYGTSKKCNYDTHIISNRHIKATSSYKERQNSAKIQPQNYDENNHNFNCLCGKEYLCRQSLWRHKKYCQQNNIHIDQSKFDGIDKDELIVMLLKQNADLIKGQQDMMKCQQDIMTENKADLKEIVLEIVKNGTHNTTTTTTHTNSHNKAFNLNFFLNETCKNAMNITDFVDSIKLQLSDFMEVGEVGYIQGISNIIVKKLNALDETIRPIHCTDQKRETFYVKDENKWEKEEEDFNRIRKMIKKVAYKNEKLMSSYKEKYPDYNDPDSKRSDQYSKTVIEALGGDGENYKEKENKIIRNISRATHLSGKNK